MVVGNHAGPREPDEAAAFGQRYNARSPGPACSPSWTIVASRSSARNPNGAQTEFAADLDHQPPHDRVQVHVFVRVGVIQCQAGRGKGLELRADLPGELAPDIAPEEVLEPQTCLVGGKPAVRADKIRDVRGIRDGQPFNDHQMQANW